MDYLGMQRCPGMASKYKVMKQSLAKVEHGRSMGNDTKMQQV